MYHVYYIQNIRHLFLGLTLSGEPDIPRDKVSPKNKMSNILFIGNL
jgi:hypothetical protein